MPTYARIDDGIVAELYTPPAELADTPIAEFVPCQPAMG